MYGDIWYYDIWYYGDMKIVVKAKPNSKIEKVEKLTQPTLDFENTPQKLDVYKVSIKEPPVDGKANRALVQALARYFGIAPSLVRLVSGPTSKQKVFEVDK